MLLYLPAGGGAAMAPGAACPQSVAMKTGIGLPSTNGGVMGRQLAALAHIAESSGSGLAVLDRLVYPSPEEPPAVGRPACPRFRGGHVSRPVT